MGFSCASRWSATHVLSSSAPPLTFVSPLGPKGLSDWRGEYRVEVQKLSYTTCVDSWQRKQIVIGSRQTRSTSRPYRAFHAVSQQSWPHCKQGLGAVAPPTKRRYAARCVSRGVTGPGVHAPTSPPAFAAAPQAFGPSPFGPSAFTQGHVQSPPAGVSVPAHAGATGAAFPPLTSPGDAFSTPPFFGSSPAFAPATFSAAPLSAHPPPAEDAFAAIAEEALRSSPRAPVGFKARDRSRTSSITSEPGVSPSETKEAPSATGVLASGGPQGGLAGLQVVPVPEVSGVALETLPDAGQELPPLPDAPVRFESKGAPPVAVDAAVSTQPPHGPKSQPAFNGPAAHSGAAFAPGAVDAKVPTPLGPPVVVEAGAAVDGHQTAAETPDWDAFFVDRCGSYGLIIAVLIRAGMHTYRPLASFWSQVPLHRLWCQGDSRT